MQEQIGSGGERRTVHPLQGVVDRGQGVGTWLPDRVRWRIGSQPPSVRQHGARGDQIYGKYGADRPAPVPLEAKHSRERLHPERRDDGRRDQSARASQGGGPEHDKNGPLRACYRDRVRQVSNAAGQDYRSGDRRDCQQIDPPSGWNEHSVGGKEGEGQAWRGHGDRSHREEQPGASSAAGIDGSLAGSAAFEGLSGVCHSWSGGCGHRTSPFVRGRVSTQVAISSWRKPTRPRVSFRGAGNPPSRIARLSVERDIPVNSITSSHGRYRGRPATVPGTASVDLDLIGRCLSWRRLLSLQLLDHPIFGTLGANLPLT
jgi:hypothetical protein